MSDSQVDRPQAWQEDYIARSASRDSHERRSLFESVEEADVESTKKKSRSNEQHAEPCLQDPQQRSHREFFNSSLASKKYSRSLSVSSRRVHVSGLINGVPITPLTIDTASDIACISQSLFDEQPNLSRPTVQPVPPDVLSLRAANGSPITILGFMTFELTLGDQTRKVDAVLVPTLGPDYVILDNSTMSNMGATLDWSNERLSFANSQVIIPATHRMHSRASMSQPSHAPSVQHSKGSSAAVPRRSHIAAVSSTFEPREVRLQGAATIPAGHATMVCAYTDSQPVVDCDVVIEPPNWSVEQLRFSDAEITTATQNAVTARTLSSWQAKDGAVWVQLANPSAEHIKVPADTVVGSLTTVSTVEPDAQYLSAVASMPNTPDQIRQAQQDLRKALDLSFADTTFSEGQRDAVITLCAKFRPIFSLNTQELGRCKIAEAQIPLKPGTEPVNRAPYRANPKAAAAMQKCVKEMLETDIIEERPSPWSSPCCLVAKKTGAVRFCVDYRATINRNLERHSWPMPNLTDYVEATGGAKFITVADIQSAFWQLPMAEKDIPLTAFSTPAGKYCFKVLPFGLSCSPWAYMNMMSKVLQGIGPDAGILCYIDDLIVFNATWEEHYTSLERLFQALLDAGLTLKPAKIHFGPKQVNYLGHVLSANGISIGNDRTQAITEVPQPQSIKDLRSFLGMCNFVRRFIPRYADVSGPLVELTKKAYEKRSTFKKAWNTEHTQAFLELKRLISSAEVLRFPDFERKFEVHVDASQQGVGAFLAQQPPEATERTTPHVIAYYSYRFKHGQRHYAATMKECLGVVLAFAHFRPYIWGRFFECHTDHQALCHLHKLQETSNMLTRWALALQTYDFEVIHVPGKLHVIPDALSRLFPEIDGRPVPQTPRLAAICRNVPPDVTFRRPFPPEYEIDARKLEEVERIHDDKELFASAVSAFPLLDAQKFLKAQRQEFSDYFAWLDSPTTANRPQGVSPHDMSHFFTHEGRLYRSYLPGNIRKLSTFKDQLVVPTQFRTMIMEACHDLPGSGGHLSFKGTFDKIRDRYWWPAMSRDVTDHVKHCVSCQRRKSTTRPPELPTGHRPASRPFECVALDLVHYQQPSKGCHYVLSIIDHFTRFLLLVPIADKQATTVARNLVDRVIAVFGVMSTILTDQGREFDNSLLHELQTVFGYRKTRTCAYHPQANAVVERVHRQLHTMLAMYSNITQDDWAEHLALIQLAHNTAFHKTISQTPHYLLFGRQAVLPIDIIMGVPPQNVPQAPLEFTKQTSANLQLAYELARRTMSEKVQADSDRNSTLSFPRFKVGDRVLIHRPHTPADGPNAKLVQPWRGPYIVMAQKSPVVYRVTREDDNTESAVHLARMKPFFQRSDDRGTEPDPDETMFLGRQIPVPELQSSQPKVQLGPYTVRHITAHKRGLGAPSPSNFQYYLLLEGEPHNMGLWRHPKAVPEIAQLVESYRRKVLATDPKAFDTPTKPSRKRRG